MRFKTLGDKISLILAITGVVLILYAGAYAVGINRIVGSNAKAGKGISIHGDGKDTIWVLTNATSGLAFSDSYLVVQPGWGIRLDGDSVEANITGVGGLDDSLVTLFSAQTISAVKAFTDTLRLGANGADGVLSIFSEQGGTDYKLVFKPHATMTQDVILTWPSNDGDASQFLQTDGSGNLSFATPAGGGDANKSDIGDTANVLRAEIGDTANIVRGEIGDTADVLRAEIGDTLWTHLDDSTAVLWTAIHDTAGMLKDAIHDSIWHVTFWGGSELSIRSGVSGQLSVYYPLSNDSVDFFVRHINEGASANQVDTVAFSGFLPVDLPDIDSVTFNMRSTDTDTGVSGLGIRIAKRTTELGAATVIYTGAKVASSVAGAWRHITIAGASIDPIAGGNKVRFWFVALGDASQIVEHDKPRIWYVGR